MKIYILTEIATGKQFAYRSITAFLEHNKNIICMTNRNWSILSKNGYPVIYQGWKVNKIHAFSGSEVRADNLKKFKK
jgi:hypothetical protein